MGMAGERHFLCQLRYGSGLGPLEKINNFLGFQAVHCGFYCAFLVVILLEDNIFLPGHRTFELLTGILGFLSYRRTHFCSVVSPSPHIHQASWLAGLLWGLGWGPSMTPAPNTALATQTQSWSIMVSSIHPLALLKLVTHRDTYNIPFYFTNTCSCSICLEENVALTAWISMFPMRL